MNNDILLSRKILQWGWYKNSNTKDVFLHLLLTANWKDGEYMGQKILRGQCVFGRKQLAKDLSLSEREVRTALTHLKSTSEITIKATSKFSIITIVKYNDYQLSTDYSDQQATSRSCEQSMNNNENVKKTTSKATSKQQPITTDSVQGHQLSSYLIDQQNDQPSTNERPSNDQQSTTSNSSKSCNSINNTPIAPKGASEPATLNQYIKSLSYGESLKSAFKDFADMRRTIKHPMTVRAAQMIISKLDKLTTSEQTKIDILNQSIEHSWQGVFALTECQGQKSMEGYEGVRKL